MKMGNCGCAYLCFRHVVLSSSHLYSVHTHSLSSAHFSRLVFYLIFPKLPIPFTDQLNHSHTDYRICTTLTLLSSKQEQASHCHGYLLHLRSSVWISLSRSLSLSACFLLSELLNNNRSFLLLRDTHVFVLANLV